MIPAEYRLTQWKRLFSAIGWALLATIALTPLAEWLIGAPPRKTGKLLLQLTFLGSLMLSAPRTGKNFSQDTGLQRGDAPRLWWTGFACGALSLGIFMAALTYIGEREVKGFQGWWHLLSYGLKYMPLAFIIGILEDVTFFGLLYAVSGRRFLPPVIVYAATHFIHDDKTPYDGPLYGHGLEVLTRMGASLTSIVDHPMEAIGLALIGSVLLTIRVQTGNIWCSMGVHGGWYFARMFGRKFNKDVVGEHEWFYGTNRFCDGVLGWCVILSAGLAVNFWWWRRATEKKVVNVLSDS